MTKFKFTYRWLLFDSILMIIVGLFIAFMKESPFFLFDKFINQYFWEFGIAPDTGSLKFLNFMYSLTGACMVAWGILFYFLVKYGYKKKEVWVRNAILISALCWFPIDEFFSLYYGVYFNAIFNVPFLLLFIIPLIVSWNDFRVNPNE